jgi:cell division septation protein DedD
LSLDHDQNDLAEHGNYRPHYLGAPPSPSGFPRRAVRSVLIVLVVIAVGFLAWPHMAEWLASRPVTSSPPALSRVAMPAAPRAFVPAASLAVAAGGPSVPAVAASPVDAAPPPGMATPPQPPQKVAAPLAGVPTEPSPGRGAAKSESGSVAAPSLPAGPYWVQVGAFRDRRTAAMLARKLRAERFTVHESTAIRSASGPSESGRSEVSAWGPVSAGEPAERYEIFVSGLSPADLGTRIAARGMSVRPAADGAVIRPGLPLPDAVAISKELASQGLAVQVRRARPGAPAGQAATAPERGPGEGTLHRVRVGSFPDRVAAEEARRELAARGYVGFLTREGG